MPQSVPGADAVPMSTHANARELARQTPDSRNRYVDLLRAFSILVVVIGHWLMAAPQVVGDGLSFNQLLSTNTWSHYLTWILQVMPLFFIVGGFANAASWRSAQARSEPYGAWLRSRLRRLALPVLPLLAVWALAAFALFHAGLSPDMIRLGSQAALVPLWFLAAYLVVVALTPITLLLWERFGWGSLLAGAALACLVDVMAIGLGHTAIGFLNYVLVWGTVHGLGYAWADSRLGGVGARLAMAAGGLVATAALVVFGPYPVAMVGLITDGVNNSQPPKVTLIALAVFQAGLFLVFEAPVRRWLRRERAWAPVVMLNGRIMTIYLWHMTALIVLIAVLLLAGGAGLGLTIDTPGWWLSRPLWMVVLSVVAWPLVAVFGRFERPGVDPRPSPPTWRPALAVVLFCAGLGFLAASGVSDDDGIHGLVLALPFIAAVAGGVGWASPRRHGAG
jgi:fucose 4-O-acetylase-like acetyltransferase